MFMGVLIGPVKCLVVINGLRNFLFAKTIRVVRGVLLFVIVTYHVTTPLSIFFILFFFLLLTSKSTNTAIRTTIKYPAAFS